MPRDRDHPIFIIRRGDRLAARIKNVLYAWRFANQVDGQVVVSWLPRDKSTYGTIASGPYYPILIWDLAKFYAEGGARELIFMEGPYRGGAGGRSLGGPDFADCRPNAFRREMFAGRAETFEDTDHIVYQFEGEARADVQAEVRRLFDRLPLNPDVASVLEGAREVIGADEYVGLHVRRGDVHAVLKAAREELRAGTVTEPIKAYAVHAAVRTAPYEFYYPAVERALRAGRKIVFFSDTPGAYQHFAARYGPEALVDGTRLAQRARTDMQKAFIDFRLLSYAQEVIGTSTGYSSIATMLGGRALNTVTAAGSLEVFTRYFFDEILEGDMLPAAVRDELVAAFLPRYEVYQDKWRRLQARIPAETPVAVPADAAAAS